MSDLIRRDEALNIPVKWESAIEHIKSCPSVLSDIDVQELEDRFGEYVRFVVEDMISGDGKRWKGGAE